MKQQTKGLRTRRRCANFGICSNATHSAKAAGLGQRTLANPRYQDIQRYDCRCHDHWRIEFDEEPRGEARSRNASDGERKPMVLRKIMGSVSGLLPSSEFAASNLAERRRRGRRCSDLDSAYNDEAKPVPLGLVEAWLLYGGLLWIAATSLIGSFYVLKDVWITILFLSRHL
jgi:hypothetical protein